MTNTSPTVEKQPPNNKPTGFQLHPEHINKNGRPPAGWSWAELIREAMDEVEDGIQVKKIVAHSLLKKALEGDVQAIREIGNRIEGMPKQSVEVSGTIGDNVIRTPAKRPLESPPETGSSIGETGV